MRASSGADSPGGASVFAVIDIRTAALQDLIDAVLMICGTPEQRYR
jgi:hypothetical protein